MPAHVTPRTAKLLNAAAVSRQMGLPADRVQDAVAPSCVLPDPHGLRWTPQRVAMARRAQSDPSALEPALDQARERATHLLAGATRETRVDAVAFLAELQTARAHVYASRNGQLAPSQQRAVEDLAARIGDLEWQASLDGQSFSVNELGQLLGLPRTGRSQYAVATVGSPFLYGLGSEEYPNAPVTLRQYWTPGVPGMTTPDGPKPEAYLTQEPAVQTGGAGRGVGAARGKRA